MNIEKMRIEFESFYVEGLVERCGEGFRSTAMYSLTEKNPDGRYKNYPDFIAWWSWQASRAAIEVELPEEDSMRGDGHWFDIGVEACKEAIESLGLKTKVKA